MSALEGRAPVPGAFSIAGWTVHASRNVIERGDQSVRLEPRTMAVLLCLAGRCNQVVTRRELEDAVWPGMVVGDDALSNTIAKLRKAFGDSRKRSRFIETVPKVGYRLVGAMGSAESSVDPRPVAERAECRLAAILYADVGHPSRAAGEDDDTTHRRSRDSLDLLRSGIERHDGRVTRISEDAVLSEFATVADALRCASAVQEALRARAASVSDACSSLARIGVNVGEVIDGHGGPRGEGVNLAARLASVARPGGIWVSESVRTVARNVVPMRYELLREHAIEDLAHPARAYAVRAEAGADDATPSPVTDGRPRVAVLPFENMSGTPDDEYFADGITEDLITALSKDRWLSVVARNSTFAFKGQSVDVRRLGESLEASYVVEGSVRKAEQRVRISAQLLDAVTGDHIWAERYDRDLDDIFTVQDEISGTIAGRIEPELGTVERQRARRKPTLVLGAWDCYHLGMSHVYKFTMEANRQAQGLFRRAIELDDQFALAHARLAYCIVLDMVYYEAEPSDAQLDEALGLAQTAVELDDQESFCHLAIARVRLARREYALALIAYEAALRLNPHNAVAYCGFAMGLAFSGRLEDSLGALDEAIRLSPNDPWRPAFFSYGSMAHLLLGHFETAAEWARNAISLPHCQHWAYAHLAAALGQLGRLDEASDALAGLTRMKPEFSCGYARKHLFYVEIDEQVERYIDALREAGVPE